MMTRDQSSDADVLAKTRSRVSNGTQRLLFGDQRSAGARRYRDLMEDFAAEVGGIENLAASSQQTVRRLAQVSVELELLEAQRASGASIDAVAFVTLVNTQRRLLRDLDKLKKANPTKRGPSLQEHLQRTYGDKAASPT